MSQPVKVAIKLLLRKHHKSLAAEAIPIQTNWRPSLRGYSHHLNPYFQTLPPGVDKRCQGLLLPIP